MAHIKLQFIKEVDGEDAITIRNSAFPAIFAAVELDFPEAREIGNYSFVSCSAVKELNFPVAETVGMGAFKDCTSAESIDFPRLRTAAEQAFMGCIAAKYVYLPMVEEIGAEGMKDCAGMVELDIPNAVSLGDSALEGCTALERLYAARLTTVGKYAFKDCSSLSEAVLPGMEALNPGMFTGCSSLQALDAPFAKTVKGHSLDGCAQMKYLNLQTATMLPDNFFKDMTAMKCLNMRGSGILSRYQSVFGSWAYGLSEDCDVIGMDGIYSKTTTGQSYFDWDGKVITGVKSSMPENPYDVFATAFNQNVFQRNSKLVSIYLPRVQQVLAQSFMECPNLRRAEFPNAVVVGQQAFIGCGNLKYLCLSSMKMSDVDPQNLGISDGCIVVCSDGALRRSADGWGELNPRKAELSEDRTYAVLQDGRAVELGWSGEISQSDAEYAKSLNPSEVLIGSSVTGIGNSAFSGFSSLEKVELPDGLAEIGDYAFRGSGIRKIHIPDSVVRIGTGAFQNCQKLDTVNLPPEITQISDFTFMGCQSLLGTLDVPGKVVSIGRQAFMGCSAETENPILRIPATVSEIGPDAFRGIQHLILFKGRTNSQIKSMQNYPWGMELPEQRIRAGETEILTDADMTPKPDVVPPDPEPEITPIEDQRLEFPEIPLFNGHTARAGSAEDGMGGGGIDPMYAVPDADPNGKTVVRFANGVEESYDWRGELTSNVLQSSNIPRRLPVSISIGFNVTSIGNGAFERCGESLRSVGMQDGLSAIGESAFRGCRNLELAVLPDSVASIGDRAFLDCRRLKSANVPATASFTGDQTFLGCDYLADQSGFVIVNGVLFDYVGNEPSVQIPYGVNAIDRNVFLGTQVKTVVLPNSVGTIKENAFLGSDTIEKFVFVEKDIQTLMNIPGYPWGIPRTEMMAYDGQCTIIDTTVQDNKGNQPAQTNDDDNKPITVVCNCGTGWGGSSTPSGGSDSGGSSGGSSGGGSGGSVTPDPVTPDPVTPDPTPVVINTKGPVLANLSDLEPTGKTGLTIWTKWYTPVNSEAGLYHRASDGSNVKCTMYTFCNTSESYRHKTNGKTYWKVQILPGRRMLAEKGDVQTYVYPQVPVFQQRGHSLWCWYLMQTGGHTLGVSQETGVLQNYTNLSGVTPIYATLDPAGPAPSDVASYSSPIYMYINYSDYTQKINCGENGWQNGFCFWAVRYPSA